MPIPPLQPRANVQASAVLPQQGASDAAPPAIAAIESICNGGAEQPLPFVASTDESHLLPVPVVEFGDESIGSDDASSLSDAAGASPSLSDDVDSLDTSLHQLSLEEGVVQHPRASAFSWDNMDCRPGFIAAELISSSASSAGPVRDMDAFRLSRWVSVDQVMERIEREVIDSDVDTASEDTQAGITVHRFLEAFRCLVAEQGHSLSTSRRDDPARPNVWATLERFYSHAPSLASAANLQEAKARAVEISKTMHMRELLLNARARVGDGQIPGGPARTDGAAASSSTDLAATWEGDE